jgi:hypothetical protein
MGILFRYFTGCILQDSNHTCHPPGWMTAQTGLDGILRCPIVYVQIFGQYKISRAPFTWVSIGILYVGYRKTRPLSRITPIQRFMSFQIPLAELVSVAVTLTWYQKLRTRVHCVLCSAV